MRSDDLVPLLSGGKDKSAGFRQGKVVYWNPDTAENVISVGGSLLTNLQMLVSTEASLIQAGDTVSCVTWGNSYAIMGRVVYPGTPQAVSAIQSITNRIVAAQDIAVGYRASTAWGDLAGVSVGPSVSIRIGASGRALVFWGAEMGQAVDTSGNLVSSYKLTPHVGVQLTGANSIDPDGFNALDFNLEFPTSAFAGTATAQFWIEAGTMHLFTGLNPGDTTFTLKYRHDGINPNGRLNFGSREIAVFAL